MSFLNKFRRNIIVIKNTANNLLTESEFNNNYKKYYNNVSVSVQLFQKKILPIINKYDILQILKVNLGLQNYIVEFLGAFNLYIQSNIKNSFAQKIKNNKIIRENLEIVSEDDNNDLGIFSQIFKLLVDKFSDWSSDIQKIHSQIDTMKQEANVTIPAAKSLWDFIYTELELGKIFNNIDDMIQKGDHGWLKEIVNLVKSIFNGVGK